MIYKCTYNNRSLNTSTVFYTNKLRGAFARVMGIASSGVFARPSKASALIVGCWNGNGVVIEY